jgi:two-component system, response regulator
VTQRSVEIVLVEDNPADVELTLNALKRHNLANRVKVLSDGQEALDYFSTACGMTVEECPRLILLDLKLPKVSGLEVLEEIRRNQRTKMIPVVVLTSSAEEKDRIESYKLGVNSYIVKPVEFDSFAQSVSEIGFYWILLNRPPY